MKPQKQEDWRERIADILGLETSPHDEPNVYLIRDEHGRVTEGCDFNDEVNELAMLFTTEIERAKAEERQFILNVLDGIDIADAQMGVTGGTKAIRHALQARHIG